MGSDFTPNILRAFKNKADLGLIIPNYHPNIVRDINWGDNAESAQSILSSFEIPLSDEVFDFAAGSMFWYRPAALRQLTDRFWESLVFPDECGQTDGTVMHAIERILKPIAKMDGFDTLFVEQVCT